ncbi:hypothetical protein DI43_08905 [Geobacillus sp. CAMR12739]|nr:hypothetical protein DI43_08905 [Geobacillus sp. CAMR12739]
MSNKVNFLQENNQKQSTKMFYGPTFIFRRKNHHCREGKDDNFVEINILLPFSPIGDYFHQSKGGVLLNTTMNQEWMQSLLSSFHNGVIVIDRYNQIVFLNDTAKQLLHLEGEEWKGKDIFALLPETKLPHVAKTGERIIGTKQSSTDVPFLSIALLFMKMAN